MTLRIYCHHSVTDIQLFFKVAGNVELHVTARIVNFTNTLNVDQVNLQQSGGTAVFGDYANVNNFSQPPQNC